jgi:general L-amino acid transport system permease protein
MFKPSVSAITSLSRSVSLMGEQLNASYIGAEQVTSRICIALLVFFLLAQNDLRALKTPREWRGWVVSATAVLVALISPSLVAFLELSPTSSLPLLLLGAPIIFGFALSTGDLPLVLSGRMEMIHIFRTVLPVTGFLLFCIFGTQYFPILVSDLPMTLSLLFVVVVFSSAYIIGIGDSNPSETERRNSAFFFIVISPLLIYMVTRIMFLTNNPDDIVSRRWDVDWTFMDSPNSFDATAWPLVPVFGEDTRWTFFFAAVLNSARATLLAIVLCTILGILIGVLRMSSNKVASTMATVYVEMFRNFPLAILLFVITTQFGQFLPNYGSLDAWVFGSNSLGTEGLAYISRQGMWIPLIESWRVALFITILLSVWVVMRYRQRDGVDDSNAAVIRRSGIWGAAVVIGVLIMMGDYSTPVLDKPRLDSPGTWVIVEESSFKVTTMFTAMVLGLTLFTAAVVSEIVRGSIQALPAGQIEAAISLGLTPYQRLRLVILPQALRSMIPLLNSQYMNVWKNSSLAIVVSYNDIFYVVHVMMNNVGKLIPLFLLLLVTYQAGSLIISGIMNAYNARVTRVRI